MGPSALTRIHVYGLVSGKLCIFHCASHCRDERRQAMSELQQDSAAMFSVLGEEAGIE